MWEGDKVPESYIDEIRNPDIEYILVPSEHTKQAILNTFPEQYLRRMFARQTFQLLIPILYAALQVCL